MADDLETGKQQRSARGSAASVAQKILRWLNYAVLAASTMAAILMLTLRLVPTAWGWGFLSFSFLTMASAIMGAISTAASGRGLSKACYSCHMFLLITSTCIQGAAFLLFVSRPDAVLSHLDSSRSDYDGRTILKVDAALLVIVFIIQLVVLSMACLLHHCHPSSDYYVDLNGNKLCRNNKVREEETLVEPVAASDKEKSTKQTELASAPSAATDVKVVSTA